MEITLETETTSSNFNKKWYTFMSYYLEKNTFKDKTFRDRVGMK